MFEEKANSRESLKIRYDKNELAISQDSLCFKFLLLLRNQSLKGPA